MKKEVLFTLVILAFVFAACSPTKESTGIWINKEKIVGKSFSKVFIVVMSADIQARSLVENDLATRAKNRGYQVVKSIDAVPPTLSDPKLPAKDEVLAKVKETGCDAVFVASLLRKEEAVHYTPGTTAYSVVPYYSYYGYIGGYYNHYAPTVSTPGYYSKEKDFFMQSNLYDVASQEIMWSVQSEIFNPSSLEKFSKAYTSGLIKQLESEKLLKKK
jgi:hypothetical protein